MPQYSRKQDFLRYNIFTTYYACIEYTKIKGFDYGKITSFLKSHTRT